MVNRKKYDLTVFLSKKIASTLSERLIRYITMYSTTCDTNIPDLDPGLSNHNQEEASTVLHSIDVTRRNPFSDLAISYSETDALLILLYYFDDLCSTTVFSTGERDMPLQPLAEKIGSKVYLVFMPSLDHTRLENSLAFQN